MSKSQSKISSPRSQGAITPRRLRTRRTLSSASPAQAEARLSTVVERFVKSDKFVLSPMKRRSVLPDDTNIEAPSRASWWKRLDGSSRDVLEALDTNKMTDDLMLEEYEFQVEKNYKQSESVQQSQSSDNESVASIVVPQRKLFNQKKQTQGKFGDIMGSRKSLGKTNIEDQSIEDAQKNLFNKGLRNKPVFPAALLNSTNKTINKTVEPETNKQTRPNLFGQAGGKRKNMFTDFVLSDSEEDSEVQHKVFGFKKNNNKRISLGTRTRRMPSLTPSMTTEIDIDDWNLLPSSTMIGAQENSRMSDKDIEPVHENQDDTLTENNASLNRTKQTRKSVEQNDENDKTHIEDGNNDQDMELKTNESKKVNKTHNSSETKLNVSGKDKSSQNKSPSREKRASNRSNTENVEIEAVVVMQQQANYTGRLAENVQSLEDQMAELHGESIDKGESRQKFTSYKTQENICEESKTTNSPNDGESKQEIDESAKIQEVRNYSKTANNTQENGNLCVKDKTQELERSAKGMMNNDDSKEIGNKNQDEHMKIIFEQDKNEAEIETNLEANETNQEDVGVSEKDNIEEEEEEASTEDQDENMDKSEKEVEQSVEEEESHHSEEASKSDQDEDMDKSEEEVEQSVEEQESHHSEEASKSDQDEDMDKSEEEVEQSVEEQESHHSEEASKSDQDEDMDKSEEKVEQSVEEQESHRSEEASKSDQDEAMDKSEEEVEQSVETQESHHSEEASKSDQDKAMDKSEEEVEPSAEEQESHRSEEANKSDQDEAMDKSEEEAEQSVEEQESHHSEEASKSKQDENMDESEEEQEESEMEKDQIEEEQVQSEEEQEPSLGEEKSQNQSDKINKDQNIDQENKSDDEIDQENKDEEMEKMVWNDNDDDKTSDASEKEMNAEAVHNDEIEPNLKNTETNQSHSKVKQNSNKSKNVTNKSQKIDTSLDDDQMQEENDVVEETPDNSTQDTPGRNINKEVSKIKSPEAVLKQNLTNDNESFRPIGRSTTFRKSKSVYETMHMRHSLEPVHESTLGSEGSRNSSTEGSEWDSHRTTRKTIRQTLGKEYTTRKSLRALVMEQSAKRQTELYNKNTSKFDKTRNKTVTEDRNEKNASKINKTKNKTVIEDVNVKNAPTINKTNNKTMIEDANSDNASKINKTKNKTVLDDINEQPNRFRRSSNRNTSNLPPNLKSPVLGTSTHHVPDQLISEHLTNPEDSANIPIPENDSGPEISMNASYGQGMTASGHDDFVTSDEDMLNKEKTSLIKEISRRVTSVRSRSLNNSDQEVLDYEASEHVISELEGQENSDHDQSMQDQKSESENEEEMEQSEQELESAHVYSQQEIEPDSEHEETEEEAQEMEEQEQSQQDIESDQESQEIEQEPESEEELSENESDHNINVSQESVNDQSDREVREPENENSDQEDVISALTSKYKTPERRGVSRIVFDSNMMSVEEIDFEDVSRPTENDITENTEREPENDITENNESEVSPTSMKRVSEPVHDVSVGTRKGMLLMRLDKIAQQNMEQRQKIRDRVQKSLKATGNYNFQDIGLKLPTYSIRRPQEPRKPKSKPKPTGIHSEALPKAFVEDLNYKPPKRFQPASAPWITKRLYKFLETKLEPKYDYRARVRAEELVQTIFSFSKLVRRRDVAPQQAVDELKREMARLRVVNTHDEFYDFFREFMPTEIRLKVNPDFVNKIPMPRNVFSEIL